MKNLLETLISVSEPTHQSGHNLDWVMMGKDVHLTDPTEPNALSHLYNTVLQELLDKHAPLKKKLVSQRRASSWTVTVDVMATKSKRYPVQSTIALKDLGQCCDEVRRWMLSNKLKLNSAKTDCILVGKAKHRRIHVPSHCNVLKNETSVVESLGFQANISDLNITYHECGISITSFGHSEELPCVEGRQYEHQRKLSLVSEWDLVCERESLGDLLQTLLIFGMGIGSVLFTLLSDMYGRKFSNILAGLSFFATSTAMSFAPTYTAFAVMKVIQGATLVGASLTSSTISLEIIPARHRSKVGFIRNLFLSLSVVIYAVVAYVMRDLNWRYHQLIVGVIAGYYIFSPWVMDESSRWLAAKKKYSIIERNLKKASLMNHKDANHIITLFREKVKEPNAPQQNALLSSDTHLDQNEHSQGVSKPERKEERPFLQIFKDRQIRTLTAILCFIWVTDNLTYHGLSLNATQFHSDKYIAFGLSGVTEVFGAVAFRLTVDRFGRKKTCLVCHLISAVSLIASVIFHHFTVAVPTLSVAVSAFSLIGKFGAATSFNVLYLYTPEIFPTTIRNVGFGLGSLAGRVGGLFAPFTRMLYRKYPWAPGTVFGSCCIMVAFLVRLLPETNKHELPQTVPEMKQWLNQQRESQKKKQRKSTIAENAAGYEN
ncbi:solute carrier family 22 member 6-like [Haliotis asinina]|uniref:solute carrier family 22 member 6-like n=1 Tax=Haliotis asinina TaxID=109174 RepID=UPI003531A7D5